MMARRRHAVRPSGLAIVMGVNINKARGDNCAICGQRLLGLRGDGSISADLGNFAIAHANITGKLAIAGAINHPATAHN